MKRIVSFIFILISFILVMTGTAFGLFNLNKQIKTENYTMFPEQTFITVSNEKQLLYVSLNPYNNTAEKVSDVSHRKLIKFNNDIALSQSLFFSSDFNLDLNGYTLDLAGNDFVVNHTFFGNTTIANGQIVNTQQQGKIIFITPNSVPAIGASISSELLEYKSFDALELSQEVFTFLKEKVFPYGVSKYITTDIVLPENYMGYNIEINCASSKPNIISNQGKLLDNSITQDVNMTISFDIGEQTFSDIFEITVVSPQDYNTILNVGQEFIYEVFQAYQNPATNEYILHDNVMLPSEYSYLDIAFSYISLDNFQDRNILSNDIYGNILMSSEPKILYLEVKAEYLAITYTFDIQAHFAFTDKYSIVNGILSELGVLVIYNEETVINLINLENYPQSGLINIDYGFIGNEQEYYFIENNALKVNTLPTALDSIILIIDFCFGDQTIIKKYTAINIESSAGSGAGVDKFYVYYLYLNQMLKDTTNGFTYNSFSMPQNYVFWNGSQVEFEYQVSAIPSNIISLSKQSDSWSFNININNIPYEDTIVTVLYYDSFSENSSAIYTLTSSFIIPGIVRQGLGAYDIPDNNLYIAMLETYGGGYDYLLTSQLNIPMNLFIITSTISNFKGIHLLKNTYAFDFSNTSFNNSDLLYLEGLHDLNSLNLSYNLLTSLNNLPLLSGLSYIDLSYNNIDWFNDLQKLSSLQQADIYANNLGSLYGSKGIYNSDVFIQLTINGVNIYNDYNTQKILFSYNDDMLAASRILKSIIYQNVASSISIISRPNTVGQHTIQYIDLTNTRYLASVTINSNIVYKIFDIIIG